MLGCDFERGQGSPGWQIGLEVAVEQFAARGAKDLASRQRTFPALQNSRKIKTSTFDNDRCLTEGHSRSRDDILLTSVGNLGATDAADAYAQTVQALRNVQAALERAGARLADVVRTRIFVTDAGYISEVMRAHGEMFAKARPACTAVVVELLDPRWLVEIEAEAYVG